MLDTEDILFRQKKKERAVDGNSPCHEQSKSLTGDSRRLQKFHRLLSGS